eukprot:TRINITY_DN3805_c0_g1_i11.p1 TRINITY_DN3805_c0_g1~~TRINITY_DN3805_c0_g1_i11.p1  ORF type:complete len:820 (-),score=125.04 TRINITY_DN3805_c0_g1_i11:362-2821(-)
MEAPGSSARDASSKCSAPCRMWPFANRREAPVEWLMGASRRTSCVALTLMGFTWFSFGIGQAIQGLHHILYMSLLLAGVVVVSIAVGIVVVRPEATGFMVSVVIAHASSMTLLSWGYVAAAASYPPLAPRFAAEVWYSQFLSFPYLLATGLRMKPSAVCLLISLANACCATVAIIVTSHMTENDVYAFDSYCTTFVPCILALTSIFFWGVYEEQLRWRTLYDSQQELAAEKQSFKCLLGMVCDAGIWLGADCNQVLRSDKRFDALMGETMTGQELGAHLGAHDRLRMKSAMEGRGAPVLVLPMTLLRARGTSLDVELFIVSQGQAFASCSEMDTEVMEAISSTSKQKLGYLVGIRIAQGVDEAVFAADSVSSAAGRWKSGKWSINSTVRFDLDNEDDDDLERGRRIEVGSVAPSRHSAPAALEHSSLLQFMYDATECKNGEEDCLPPDAVAWVEGACEPMKLSSVLPGQRVLCFDHLSRSLKYSTVEHASMHDAQESSWVTVKLADGTKLPMTSDHPVFARVLNNEGLAAECGPIRAQDLQPGRHALEVFTRTPVVVDEVAEMLPLGTAAGAPATRVSLSVRQADRHSIFVSRTAGGEPGIAVASAKVTPMVDYRRVSVKNTFIDDPLEYDEDIVPLPRVRSAPDLTVQMASGATSVANVATSLATTSRGMRSILSLRSSLRSSTAKSSLKSSEPTDISDSSAVIVCGPQDGLAPLASSSTQPRASSASLLEYQVLRKGGIASHGSRGHAEGDCYPCLMQQLWYDGKFSEPCKFGHFCGRCHEPHSWAERRQRRRQVKRDLNAARVQGSNEGGADRRSL